MLQDVKEAGGTPLVSEFADDPDMTELIEQFVGSLGHKQQALRAALARTDYATLKTLAHQLKGAAGGYGFTPITAAAAVLEEALLQQPQPQLDEVRNRMAALLGLCQRAVGP